MPIPDKMMDYRVHACTNVGLVGFARYRRMLEGGFECAWPVYPFLPLEGINGGNYYHFRCKFRSSGWNGDLTSLPHVELRCSTEYCGHAALGHGGPL